MDDIIREWTKGADFRNQAEAVLSSIVTKTKKSRSEAETSAIFERELYFLIRAKTGIEISFHKETPVNGVVHSFYGLQSRKSGRGRIDAIVNNLIIEYKHHSKLENKSSETQAYEQVCDYLIAMRNTQGIQYDAILTDGRRIAYFQHIGEEIRHTALHELQVSDMEMIVGAILNNSTKKFAPSNIIQDFSISEASSSDTRDLARNLFHEICDNATGKTLMLLEEWKCLMHLSSDDNGKSSDIEKRRNDLSVIFGTPICNNELEHKALFALQTTYAIIVKLIACKVVDKLRLDTDEVEHGFSKLSGLNSKEAQKFFQNIEDGYTYSSYEIRNFLEGDFFSWYADRHQWSESFYKTLQKLIYKLDDYSSFSLNVKYSPVDIFKDLYMNIMPQSVRHSMGEYFTPEWLADSVITEAAGKIGRSAWKAIDPCCGSGIFIISLIRKIVGDCTVNELTEAQKTAIRKEILSRVYGIDINPISVLSARVGYYLAIHPFGEPQDIEIPVYLGDSAIIPHTVVIDNIDCFEYSVNNLKSGSFDIVLPQRLVKNKDFGKTMSYLQKYVKAESKELLYTVLTDNLIPEELNSKTLTMRISDFCDSMIYLHKNHWDGIWIRIVTNFMLIARLEGFDLIVGNPPWVKWEHLPSSYTKKIKEFCDVRHIFCNDGGMYGGAQLNICALIANVTASNWLRRDGGMLAFLMPDSIMSQNSYEEFRNFYTDYDKGERMYLQEIDKWEAPLRPFKYGNKSVTQDFNTYYFGFEPQNYKDGIKVRKISKLRGTSDLTINKCLTATDARNFLTIDCATAKQLADNSTAFTYVSENSDFCHITGESSYRYRTGVESTPFEIFKMTGAGPSAQSGHYRFRNKVLKASKYKVTDIPENGWDLSVQHIYPMVEGPCIKPFTYEVGNNFHIIPYDENNTGTPVPLDKLYREDPELAAYFCSHKDILELQSEKSKIMHQGSEFYALSKIGKYTFAPYIVAARDNSYFCSSVIRPTMTPWGELKKSVCVKHTIIISQDINDNFISEKEAHFINGILNSTVVHDYIHSTFKTNGFSLTKSKLFLPKFQEDNILHNRVVSLSRKATQSTQEERPDIAKELSGLYIQICLNENK